MPCYYRQQTKFAKVMFLHVSVCPQGGGVSQHALQVSVYRGGIPACIAGLPAHTQEKVEGSGLGGGVSRPTPGGKLKGLAGGSPVPHPGEVEGSGLRGSQGPHLGGLQAHTQGGLQAHTQGVVSQHVLRQTPPTPSRWLLQRAVCILLECILVLHIVLVGTPIFINFFIFKY